MPTWALLRSFEWYAFFDAAFVARSDGSSQAGYVIMLLHKSLLEANGPEGAYHILDWRSMKTPRIARSSLGTEAQSGGQACDALEHASIYWSLLMDPRQSLQHVLNAPSLLAPVMVTDAKALFDSYHREGVSSSVVDRRVSLEIRVMKDRLSALGGNLRWMSSEKQIADGLTKEAARLLLAQRLRHGRLKLVWDPSYKAATKKSKEELQQSRIESVQESPKVQFKDESLNQSDNMVHYEPYVTEELERNVNEHPIDEDQDPTNKQVHENVIFARTNDAIVYVNRRSSHVVPGRLTEPCAGFKKYFLQLLCLFVMVPQLVVGTDLTDKKKEEIDFFGMLLFTGFLMVMSSAFLAGRWTHQPGRPAVAEVAVQKDELVLHFRLRKELAKAKEEVSLWRNRAVQSKSAASESRAAADMVLAYQCIAENLLSEANDLLRLCIRQMDEHSNDCPFYQKIWMSRHGHRWHATSECTSLIGREASTFRLIERCHLCSVRMLPPDLINPREGEPARVLVFRWLDAYEQRLMDA